MNLVNLYMSKKNKDLFDKFNTELKIPSELMLLKHERDLWLDHAISSDRNSKLNAYLEEKLVENQIAFQRTGSSYLVEILNDENCRETIKEEIGMMIKVGLGKGYNQEEIDDIIDTVLAYSIDLINLRRRIIGSFDYDLLVDTSYRNLNKFINNLPSSIKTRSIRFFGKNGVQLAKVGGDKTVEITELFFSKLISREDAGFHAWKLINRQVLKAWNLIKDSFHEKMLTKAEYFDPITIQSDEKEITDLRALCILVDNMKLLVSIINRAMKLHEIEDELEWKGEFLWIENK